jgi:hypothetical protein
MADIDQIGNKVEGLIEKVKNLKYKFSDEQNESDANDAKEEAVAALESWLEIVTTDYEAQETEEDEES